MNTTDNTGIYMPEDIMKELDRTNSSTQKYFDLMYNTLQFTFAAIVAVIGVGFSSLSEDSVPTKYISLLFSYILPMCLYVFGVMYVYNAYALARRGKKIGILQRKLYWRKTNVDIEFDEMMKSYVTTKRRITLIAYGVPLGFFW